MKDENASDDNNAQNSSAKNIGSQQLGFGQGAHERGEGVYIEYMTEAERMCNNAQNPSAKSRKKVWQELTYFITLGFGSGLLPIAPGTWGTLAGMIVYLLIAWTTPAVYFFIASICFGLGVIICGRVSRDLGVHDHSFIVWDEVVGYLFTMFLAPPGAGWMLAGFVLFRIFDVWKIPPISWIDKRVHGGFGIMLDDLVAALFAWCGMRLLMWGFL